MTARVVPIERARRSGRQPAEVEALRDLRDELVATIAEDLDHARQLLTLTRQAMRAVAHGQSPATYLEAIEQRIHRLTHQRAAGAAELRAGVICPDGAEVRHLGHGVAA